MARAVEPGDAFNDDPLGAGAGNARAHLVEASGHIGDFRFARGVLDHGRAVGERCRHDRRMGAADGHLGKDDLRALEPMRRLRHHIAAVDLDLGAEPFHGHDEQVDRPRADGAAAGQRNPRFAHARQERRQDPEARPHLGDEVVGRGGIDDMGCGNMQRLAVVGGLAGAFAADRDVDAMVAEDAFQERHIGKARHVIERQGLVGQEARDHQRQRGVFRPRDRDRAVEPAAADECECDP